MSYKLGKKPARAGAIKMKFAAYLNHEALPTPPLRFMHLPQAPLGMLGNDAYSDCVFAGAAHEHMVWKTAGGSSVQFDTSGVLSDYSALTGFNPSDPATDQGTDMQEAASYRRKTGVVDSTGTRHKIDAYAALDPGRVEDIVLAAYLFGACGIGIQFPDYAMDQFDAQTPWTFDPSAPAPRGGHYIPCVGRNITGNLLVITWGRLHAMTLPFFQAYCDEAVAYLSLETLKNSLSPEGFDEAALRDDLKQLTA